MGAVMKPSVLSLQGKIRQRRAQMLVHSCLYYWMDDNIVSDDQWQQWANELTSLQKAHPGDCKIDFYDEAFADWTGATGAHLPKDVWVLDKARKLQRYHNETLN